MELRSLLASAIGIGVGLGLGLGLGLASARWAKLAHEGGSAGGAGVTEVEAELRRLVGDCRDSDVTFDEFHHLHCYLRLRADQVLISAAFVHLKQVDFSKHIRNFSAASRAILLSGPTVARQSSVTLLILDVTDFSLRIQSKYGNSSKGSVCNQSTSETTFGRMSDFIGSFTMFPKKDEPRARRTSSWCFDEKVLIQSFCKVMVSVAESDPIILYIRASAASSFHILFEQLLE